MTDPIKKLASLITQITTINLDQERRIEDLENQIDRLERTVKNMKARMK